MTRKKGVYQKQKLRRDRFSDVLAILSIALMALILLGYVISNAIAVRQIRNNTLEVYNGHYTFEIKRTYGKNSHHYYRIALDNGDVLTISINALENGHILEKNQVLTFRYSKAVRRALFTNEYTILAADSAESGVTLVDLNTTHKNCVRSIWLFSVLLAVWLLVFCGLLLLYYLAVNDNKRRVIKRNG